MSSLLSEVVPHSSVISRDERRPQLAQRLRTIARHDAVPEGLREQAARLAAVADDPVVATGRVGIVWIAWYDASWQANRDDPDLVYEDSPGFASLAGALEWARDRSGAVVARPAWDHGRSYWAGTADDPSGLPLPADPPGT